MEGEALGDLGDRNKATLDYWMGTWVRNLMQNYQTLSREAKAVQANMQEGFGTYRNISITSEPRRPLVPALVCGSGPSLDDVLPYIRDFPGVIFCGGSHMTTIAASGRDPDYMVCLDANEDVVAQITTKGREWSNTTLITHPAINPGIIRFWKWRRKLFRPIQLNNEFFEKTLPMMYPFIEVSLLNAGCTVNTELELANFLGCSPVILAGVDFAFTDSRRRCSQWKWDDSKWARMEDGPLMTRYSLRVSKNGYPTTEEMIAYKQNLFLVARTDCTNIYTCSRGIIRPEETMGYVEPPKLLDFARNPPQFVPKEEAEKLYDRTLSGMGIALEEDQSGAVRVTSRKDKKRNLGSAKSTISFIPPKGKSSATVMEGVLGNTKAMVVEKPRVMISSPDDGKTIKVSEAS